MEDLLKLFESIRRWKLLVVAVGVVAMLLALTLALSKDSSYTATSTLVVGAADPQVNRAPDQDAIVARGYVDSLINTPTYQARLAEQADLPDSVTIEGRDVVGSPFIEITATAPNADQAVAAANAASTAFVNDTRGTIQENLKASLEPARQQLRDVAGQIPGVEAQLADSSSLSAAQEAELRGKLAELQTTREALTQSIQNGTSFSANPNLVTVFSQPTVASENKPKVLSNAILGLFGGLVLGSAIALVLGALQLRISTPGVVRSKLGLPTLASISGTDSQQQQEDLQGLASGMSLMASGLTSVAVTSPGMGEGKTLVASNLARYRAALGDRVILIDANLRNPASSNGRGRDQDGLAQLLGASGAIDVPDVLVDTGIPNLSLLPAGATTEVDRYALLTGERMSRVLERAAPFADLLVIDTSALLGAPESQVVCSMADRTVLVLDSGATQTSAAVEARDVLDRVHAKVLGVVLTRVAKRRLSGIGGARPADK